LRWSLSRLASEGGNGPRLGGRDALPAFAMRSADLRCRFIEDETEAARDSLKGDHE
jgi:hypothetical protein